MRKSAHNTTVITDAEVDEIVQILEALHAETGSMNVFRIIEIIMRDTIESIKAELNATNKHDLQN